MSPGLILRILATFEATHSPLYASIDPHQEAASKRVYFSLSATSNRDTVVSSNCGAQAGDFVAYPGANIGTKVSKLQWMGCSKRQVAISYHLRLPFHHTLRLARLVLAHSSKSLILQSPSGGPMSTCCASFVVVPCSSTHKSVNIEARALLLQLGMPR